MKTKLREMRPADVPAVLEDSANRMNVTARITQWLWCLIETADDCRISLLLLWQWMWKREK